MCGICGIIAADPRADVAARVAQLTSALAHRGPDGAGLVLERGRSIGLGHRRLSIVDIAGGAQPMSTPDGRLHLVYNGEIYNHGALRADLTAAGYQFRTRSDTEVILAGWAMWGAGLLPRLNGIFAFAILDGRAGDWQVTLVRDPVGAKPLYFGCHDNTWWFASELGAARSAGVVGPVIDDEALAQFLVYRFIPAPRTAYRAAWKVPAGHLIRLAPGKSTEPHFESFPRGFCPASVPSTRGEWEDTLGGLIRQAISRQMMSDVPLGLLLSGGVDSAIVARCMQTATGSSPDCFAIGFQSEPGGGELAEARRAADALGIRLRQTEVSDAVYLAAWPGLLRTLGEPIANSGVLLVGLLCGAVAVTHKVVLSGQGADEPLGGYPRHAAGRWAPWLRRAAPLLQAAPEWVATGDRIRRLRRLAGQGDEARWTAEVLAVFGVEEAMALSRAPVSEGLLTAPAARALAMAPPNSDPLNRLLMTDAQLSLSDDLLLVADHMSMAHSVELRVPFLDLELLGLAERMPGSFKVSLLGERKWLYRRAASPMLPPGLRRRLLGPRARLGRKLGFTTPLDRWFADWVHSRAETMLLGRGAILPDFLQSEPINHLLAEARAGRPRTRQLLSLFALEGWLQGHANGGVADAG